MRVLGIDPSKSSVGWAVFAEDRILAGDAETCPHSQTKGVKGIEASYSGAVNIWSAMLAARLIDQFAPDLVAIEEPLAQARDGALGRHVKTVIFSGLAAVAVARQISVHSVPQGTWRSGVGVIPAPRGTARTPHNKAEALRLCRLLDGAAPRTHDEAEARLIARWAAAQHNPRLANATLPLMAAAGDAKP